MEITVFPFMMYHHRCGLLRMESFVFCSYLTADGPQRARLPIPPTATLHSRPSVITTSLQLSPTHFTCSRSHAFSYVSEGLIDAFKTLDSEKNRTHDDNLRDYLYSIGATNTLYLLLPNGVFLHGDHGLEFYISFCENSIKSVNHFKS